MNGGGLVDKTTTRTSIVGRGTPYSSSVVIAKNSLMATKMYGIVTRFKWTLGVLMIPPCLIGSEVICELSYSRF